MIQWKNRENRAFQKSLLLFRKTWREEKLWFTFLSIQLKIATFINQIMKQQLLQKNMLLCQCG